MNYIVQAVILVYFVGMFALGILGEQRTKDTADYYVAGRANSVPAPVISIFSLSRIFWKNALKAAPPVSLLRCLSLPFPSRCW